NRPAVHLTLIDLLRAMIEPGSIPESHGIGGRKQPKSGMRLDDLVLIEKRQLARHFQHALDDEHHVRPARVVLVEAKRNVVLQRPRQNAITEFGDLQTVANDNGILADEIDAADMAVEVHSDAWPVEPRRDLLDVRRFTGAVIAGDDDAAV